MTDDIKLPPLPEKVVISTHLPTGVSIYGYTADQMQAYASEAVKLNAQAVPDGIPLNIIRKWPDGFNDRLQHVWLDVISFIPSVKLYDLQRVLAEFGLRMEVYENAPAAPQPAQPLTDEHKAILKECRNQAMRLTLEARIPEAGAFGGIAQDLDYLCEQLGIKND